MLVLINQVVLLGTQYSGENKIIEVLWNLASFMQVKNQIIWLIITQNAVLSQTSLAPALNWFFIWAFSFCSFSITRFIALITRSSSTTDFPVAGGAAADRPEKTRKLDFYIQLINMKEIFRALNGLDQISCFCGQHLPWFSRNSKLINWNEIN